ncbi:MAG: sigma-70 family RNA polymerase sigma factor [Flavobacteriales bacterium]|nr:sigma-70 family RNA polymerase sigma factor [Flavobacteriales bacterium]MBT5933717.1 sigma-70 family RNA polymerase sigma factor [Flavobacteriales bacterium]
MEVTEDIIREVEKGNRKITLDLYHYSFNVLMSSAVRYKNHKEDQMEIVNNAFVKIVTNINSYKPGTAYFSWIKTIVQREIIDDFRKNKKYKELFKMSDSDTVQESVVEPEVYESMDSEAAFQMLNVLPPATKLVFNLYAIEGYKSKEIVEELNISYETVKWHIKQARKKLKSLIIENKISLKQ